jgi:hypothetical protein
MSAQQVKKRKMRIYIVTDADFSEILQSEIIEFLEFRKRYQIPIEYSIEVEDEDTDVRKKQSV